MAVRIHVGLAQRVGDKVRIMRLRPVPGTLGVEVDMDNQLMSRLTVEQLRELGDVSERTLRNAAALGGAIHAAHVSASPQLARAVQAEQNLYEKVEREFGLLSTAEVGTRMGSRSSAKRNAALDARSAGRLVALRRGRYLLFPGFQFAADGSPLPVVGVLAAISRRLGRSETGLIQWLCSPSGYLDGDRPVDHLDEPELVISVANNAFEVSW